MHRSEPVQILLRHIPRQIIEREQRRADILPQLDSAHAVIHICLDQPDLVALDQVIFASRLCDHDFFFCRFGEIDFNLDRLVDIFDDDTSGCHTIRDILRRNQHIERVQVSVEIRTRDHLSGRDDEVLGRTHRGTAVTPCIFADIDGNL